MRKFLHNCKGAVTVLVTLLLIPALLITGTGVDVARLYAARSATRDANLLAANSVLATYDAALQDLYGLYAIAGEDEALQTMVDTYVRASLLGEEVTDAQLGQFRLFWGPEAIDSTLTFETDSSLDNVAVLRRQIEEYAKWRVPVALVNGLIARLNSKDVEQLAEDSAAVQDKLALDQDLQELAAAYIEIKKAADELPTAYQPVEDAAFDTINPDLEAIHGQFQTLLFLRLDYEYAIETGDYEESEKIAEHYDGVLKNIDSLVNGGIYNLDWGVVFVDPDTLEETEDWQDFKHISGGLSGDARNCASQLEATKTKFDALTDACQKAQNAKRDVQSSLEQLKTTLANRPDSENDTLKANMEEEIAAYEDLASYDFVALGAEMRSQNEAYIDGVAALFRDLDGFGQVTDNQLDTPRISFRNMSSLRSMGNFAIDFRINSNSNQQELLQPLVYSVSNVTYDAPNGFLSFSECSDTHRKCYESLSKIGNIQLDSTDESVSDEAEDAVDNIEDLYQSIVALWRGLTDYDSSPGARSYVSSKDGNGSIGEARKEGLTFDLTFGNDEDGSIGGDLLSTLDSLCDLISGDVDPAAIMGNAVDGVIDRGLLVGYSTQMFSCWTTENEEKSLTGQPINAENNYFYHSELEYLYKGSLSATANLGAATATMLAIRFVANYASSYIIANVNAEIAGLESLVAAVPYVGAVLCLLVRPFVVLAESIYDVASLRSGSSVPIVKLHGYEWNISATNSMFQLAKEAFDALAEELSSGSQNTTISLKKKAPEEAVVYNPSLTYEDYLTVFLLTGDPNTVASRVGDLIALNVTTVNEKLCENNPDTKSDERAEAMKKASVLDLSKAYTTFSIKTDTEVRFMFLSMPFAQKGMNGVIPPRTFPLSETTYRGY